MATIADLFVNLWLTRTVSRKRHKLSVRGDFVALEVCVENRALAGKPKSSELSAQLGTIDRDHSPTSPRTLE
ncbi:DUF108 domain-containing protein [Bradyrhizobium sp. AUGA SZCCT0176]|nr:DUF108 domain-containing protein [Bradyrhizobium sp. AUGA SZCCT0176]